MIRHFYNFSESETERLTVFDTGQLLSQISNIANYLNGGRLEKVPLNEIGINSYNRSIDDGR